MTKQAPTSLLRNRNFILLWCAYAVSAAGDHLSEMAILKTQNALSENVDITPLTARMAFMFFLPFLFLSTPFGLLADRFSRRGLMVTADAARCAIMLGFAWFLSITSGLPNWGPFLPLALLGTFAALFSPARSALLPTLIDERQLVRANGLISGLGIIATMASVALSGYLADHYEPYVSFRLDAATYALSGVLLLAIRPPRQEAPTAHGSFASAVREVGDGFRYAAAHKHVRELLIVVSLIWFCGPLVNSVIPAIVRDVYGGTYTDISGFRLMLALGFVVGSIIVSVLGRALREEIAITWGLLGISLAIGLFALSVFLPLSSGSAGTLGKFAILLAGLCAVAVMAGFNSLLQRTVANRFRGRVFGLKDLCATGSLLLASGLLAVPNWQNVDRWVGYILAAVAVCMLLAALGSLRIRLRRGAFGPMVTFLSNLAEFVCKAWYRFERIGPPTVPHHGPVIIAANHVSAPDPLFIAISVRYRLVSFMVAAEYTNWPIVGPVVRLTKCIPVRRGSRDVSSTKAALKHLKSGDALTIFIEGGIDPPDKPRRPRDGVAMLAIRAKATVIPAFISGAKYHDSVIKGLLSRHNVRVRFGPPVDLSDLASNDPGRRDMREATARIYRAILALAPEGTAPPVDWKYLDTKANGAITDDEPSGDRSSGDDDA